MASKDYFFIFFIFFIIISIVSIGIYVGIKQYKEPLEQVCIDYGYKEELESKLSAAHLYKMLDLHPVKIFKLWNHKQQYKRILDYFNNIVEKKDVNFKWKLGDYTNG